MLERMSVTIKTPPLDYYALPEPLQKSFPLQLEHTAGSLRKA